MMDRDFKYFKVFFVLGSILFLLLCFLFENHFWEKRQDLVEGYVELFTQPDPNSVPLKNLVSNLCEKNKFKSFKFFRENKQIIDSSWAPTNPLDQVLIKLNLIYSKTLDIDFTVTPNLKMKIIVTAFSFNIYGYFYILVLYLLSFSFLYSYLKLDKVYKDLDARIQKRTQALVKEKDDISQSEEKFRTLVENTPDLIFRFDLEGKINFMNSTFKKYFHIEPGEVTGKIFLHPVFPKEVGLLIKEYLDSKQFDEPSGFQKQISSGAERFHFHFRFIPETNSLGTLSSFLCIARDITDQIQSENNYQNLFNKMLGGFALHEIILDDQGEPESYKFIDINPQYEEILGLPKEDVVDQDVLDLFPNTEKYWIETYSRVALTGNPTRFESYNQDLDKYYDVFAFRPGPQQFAVMTADITERKKAEIALKKSELKFRTYIEASPTAIFMIDRNGRFDFVNEAWCSLTGYSEGELKTSQFPTSSNIDFLSKGDVYLNKLDEKGILNTEISIINKEGKKLHLVMDLIQLSENQYLSFATDITTQQELSFQLRQSQKMESIGRLTGGVAHDLNNLLTPILGYSDILLNQPDLSSLSQDRLKAIKGAANRSRILIQKLLAFSRKQILQKRPLHMGEVIDSFSKVFRRTIREDIELEFAIEENLYLIKADPSQMEQILINLLVNAQDSIKGQGKISLRVDNIDVLDNDSNPLLPNCPGSYIRLVVEDSGEGMTEETKQRIFEPFFTTKEQGRGTGLGLSTVYGIVKQHQGIVTVDSKQGQGCTFYIYFPKIDDNIPILKNNKSAEVVELLGSESILVVEDDLMVRTLLHNILVERGYQVESFSRPSKALAFAKTENQLDILITDVVMPEENGFNLFKNIRNIHPDIKVLFISGYTKDHLPDDLSLDEGLHFLPKPFEPHVILKKLRELIG